MPPNYNQKPNIKDILEKYGSKIEGQIGTSNPGAGNYSHEYLTFRNEMSPENSRYEKLCRSFGGIIKISPSKTDLEKTKRHLEIAHLDLEPWQPLSMSFGIFLGVFLFGVFSSIAYFLLKGFKDFPFLFLFLMIILSLFLYFYFSGYPMRLANKWRLKASSQMVPAILYIVVYMRHTSNLEKAIAFTSEHLQYPLKLDFMKIFYNVEIGKFSTIKESLDNYLEIWRDYSIEFIESFHLIQSSLFEPDDSRKILTLEKALQVVLEGVFDNMIKFTHNVRSPLTNVYMLGVVLPTLGLALLPLASAMVGDYIKWYHVFILFNMIIPFIVFYLTDQVLAMRPGGYGESDILERNPNYGKYKSNKAYFNALLICLPFFIVGLLPLMFQYFPVESIGLPKDISFSAIGLGIFGNDNLFDFKQTSLGIVGPFGIGALFLSLFIPLGVALFFIISFGAKTDELIVEREKTKQLEAEFNNSLFQLGSRMGNGVPPELVFGKVAESSRGLMTEDFFKRVNYNIMRGGMSVEKSIFDKDNGAIIYYPSDLIATSMKVLVESSKKGLKIAAVSLMSISEYVKSIQKITERLRDMLAEIISDMRSNMTFLAPLLSGVVIGLAVMITSILNKLDLGSLSSGAESGVGNFSSIIQIFDLSKMIPPYFLQISVGLYLIQIIFILTGTLIMIDSGEDKLSRISQTGKNLKKGIFLYFATALLATFALFALTSIVIGGISV